MTLPCGHTPERHGEVAAAGLTCPHEAIDRLLSELLSDAARYPAPTLLVIARLWPQFASGTDGKPILVEAPFGTYCREAGWAMLLAAGLRSLVMASATWTLSPTWTAKQPRLDHELVELVEHPGRPGCFVCGAREATGLSNSDLLVQCAALSTGILQGAHYPTDALYRHVSQAKVNLPAALN